MVLEFWNEIGLFGSKWKDFGYRIIGEFKVYEVYIQSDDDDGNIGEEKIISG